MVGHMVDTGRGDYGISTSEPGNTDTQINKQHHYTELSVCGLEVVNVVGQGARLCY